MANSDKNILITPNRNLGGIPEITFTGAGNSSISLKILDETTGTLSFENSSNRLFSIDTNFSSGTLFSTTEVTNVPAIDVQFDGSVTLSANSGLTEIKGKGLSLPQYNYTALPAAEEGTLVYDSTLKVPKLHDGVEWTDLGPVSTVTDSLLVHVDPGRYNSTPKNYSLLTLDNWNLGSGGVTFYGQNGDTNENERVIGTDPWGNAAIVWESRPSGNGNADGGWNTDYVAIDNTKLYRFSVWIKRTSSTSGGNFYLGMYSAGGTFGTLQGQDSSNNTNPYWECPNTGSYNQNVWYLVSGHCYPYTEPNRATPHPDSGAYAADGKGTKFKTLSCNTGTGDLRFRSDNTVALHRCYHFYCGDSTTRLQWFEPRIDVCDGTEPSILDMLNGTHLRTTNLLYKTNPGYLLNGAKYVESDGGGVIQVDGNKDYVSIGRVHATSMANFTVSVWFKTDFNGVANYRNVIDCNYAYNGSTGNIGPRFEMSSSGNCGWLLSGNTGNNGIYDAYTVLSSGLKPNVWHQSTITRNSSGQVNVWFNGVQTTVNGSNPNGFVNEFANVAYGRGFHLSSLAERSFKGLLGELRIYDRVLTSDEVLQNYNSLRRRYRA